MINKNYSKSYTQILEILKYLPKAEYEMIPKSEIEFFENNKDVNYNYSFNPSIDFKEQNVLRETCSLIILLFKNFFASDIEKQKIDIILEKNEEKYQEELREKYNPDDIFHKKASSVTQDLQTSVNLVPVTNNNKWYQKIFLFFKKILNRNIND